MPDDSQRRSARCCPVCYRRVAKNVIQLAQNPLSQWEFGAFAKQNLQSRFWALSEQRGNRHEKDEDGRQGNENLWAAHDEKHGAHNSHQGPGRHICPRSRSAASRHSDPEGPQQKPGPDKTAAPDILIPGIKNPDEQSCDQTPQCRQANQGPIELLSREGKIGTCHLFSKLLRPDGISGDFCTGKCINCRYDFASGTARNVSPHLSVWWMDLPESVIHGCAVFGSCPCTCFSAAAASAPPW